MATAIIRMIDDNVPVPVPFTSTTSRNFGITKIDTVQLYLSQVQNQASIDVSVFISFDNKYWIQIYNDVIPVNTNANNITINVNKNILSLMDIDNDNSIYTRIIVDDNNTNSGIVINRVDMYVDIISIKDNDIIINDCCDVEYRNDIVVPPTQPTAYDYNKFHNYILKMIDVVSSSYSIDALYFRTEPVEIDYVIGQYVIRNISDVKCVKITTQDAIIPDTDFSLETDQVEYLEFDNKYLYITQKQFMDAFGNYKPSERDYIFIPITNRLYEIVRVKPEFGPMMVPVYWTLSVKKFNPNIDIINSDEYLSKIGKFIKSIDYMFKPQQSDDFRKVRQPTVTQNENDNRYVNDDNTDGVVTKDINIERFLGYVIKDREHDGVYNDVIVSINGINVNNRAFSGHIKYKLVFNSINTN